jgi:glutamyl-tRNA synthetase
MNPEVRVRFAPSPTGYLHVGGARTALFNYLFARRLGGTFILRIEDTDRSRYSEEALQEIFASLKWLGLDWDEGPLVGGDAGPYVQSERTALYRQAVQQLIDQAKAYYCFCTSAELEQIRDAQQAAKAPIAYDRRSRDLSAEEIEKNLAENKPFVVRLKVPLGREVAFDDLVRGHISFQTDVLEDLVLLKSDGFPTYHLANVVDDHSMRITHVLRGDEWIKSTPSHVLLYEAFGWQHPIFTHLPIILDPSGGKLSKRKGAASVMDYKNQGYLPEALFNFLALLGWSPGDDREKMSREETIEAFDLNRVNPKASVFDDKKLEWMNGLYMQDRSVASVADEVVTLWKQAGLVAADCDEQDEYLHKVIALMKDRSKRITELAQNASYFFVDPAEYEEKGAKKYFKEDAVAILLALSELLRSAKSFDAPTLEALYRDYAEHNDLGGGKLIHPTRLAVSGVSFGPGLFELLELLGQERVVRRIDAAIVWLKRQ